MALEGRGFRNSYEEWFSGRNVLEVVGVKGIMESWTVGSEAGSGD